MKRTIGLALLCIALSTRADAQVALPRVYIFATPTVGGFVDPDSVLRDKAVTAAKAWIQKRYKRDAAVAEDRENADVIVEVMEAPEDTSKQRSIYLGFGITTSQRVTGETQIRARLMAGEYSTIIFTQHKNVSTAGKIVGQEVAKWVRANRTRLNQQEVK